MSIFKREVHCHPNSLEVFLIIEHEAVAPLPAPALPGRSPEITP